ncbi:MAG TPA: 6,7-dimethyl-8-ribityllumazine synthase [Chitinophagaceae bacterium]|nr:6,7-dimethyl-8-ribityllumazine synthase [Chitinophagaceae bacterium]
MGKISESNLLNTSTGILKAKDACVVIVKTEWNQEITDLLEAGCRAELKKHKVKKIRTITVPGAVEIPFVIQSYWKNLSRKDKPSAFIALGCVIRGGTPHFEYVCKSVTEGVLQLNLLLPIPTIFGVLTVDSMQQAQDRVGGKIGHKGIEAAVTALKMIALNQSFKK